MGEAKICKAEALVESGSKGGNWFFFYEKWEHKNILCRPKK